MNNLKILVTGVAGFIGSNIALDINKKYKSASIVGVDNLRNNKFKNLIDVELVDYYDKNQIEECLNSHDFDIIFHQGACSDTMEMNEKYIIENNFNFSKRIFKYAREKKSRLIYASSAATYGLGHNFEEIKSNEKPLNPYGYSKLLFDNFVRQSISKEDSVVGLRYFNVYGKREQHKGRMSSVIFHFYNQYLNDKKIKIFGEYGGFSNGMHERDFIFIDDIVDVNLKLTLMKSCGIFNLGSGSITTYNEVGVHVINSILSTNYSLDECLNKGIIKYVDFPDDLKGKYQTHTKANLNNLIKSGLDHKMTPISIGIKKYVDYLIACE